MSNSKVDVVGVVVGVAKVEAGVTFNSGSCSERERERERDLVCVCVRERDREREAPSGREGCPWLAGPAERPPVTAVSAELEQAHSRPGLPAPLEAAAPISGTSCGWEAHI